MNIAMKTPLPDILPSEATILELSTQQVADILCQYTLESIDQIHQRFRPGIESSVGFLSSHQWLAPTIIHDARRLKELRIDRGRIADALELLSRFLALRSSEHLKEADPDRYESVRSRFEEKKAQVNLDLDSLELLALPGRHVADPFHPTYDNPTVNAHEVYWVIRKEDVPTEQKLAVGASPEKIWPQDKCIRFTRLHPSLISRACFFEGPGTRFRLDPEKCVRVLRLAPSEEKL